MCIHSYNHINLNSIARIQILTQSIILQYIMVNLLLFILKRVNAISSTGIYLFTYFF